MQPHHSCNGQAVLFTSSSLQLNLWWSDCMAIKHRFAMQEYSMATATTAIPLHLLLSPPLILNFRNTPQIHLHLLNLSIILRICRASWTVYKYQSHSSSVPRAICFWRMPAGLLEIIRHGPPLPAWRANAGDCWGHAQRHSQNIIQSPHQCRRISKIFSITSGNGQNPWQQKDLWLYNTLLKISADGHKTERVSQKNCMM